MSAFAFGIRARGNDVLTLDQVRQHVPSLFAEQPHASRSDRFVHISSIDVLNNLMTEGFDIVEARQGRVRDQSRREYTKHMVRLRQRSDVMRTTARRVGDTHFEVVLRNASDGTQAYTFDAGLFRLICLNGMVASDGTFASVHVRHSGNRERAMSEVIEGAFSVVEAAPRLIDAVSTWGNLMLNNDERMALAESAHVLRFGDAEGHVDTPIQPRQLLNPRRTADQGADLWRTFNTIQENTIRGGLTAMGRDGLNRPRRSTTREVRGIDQDIKLNKALWMLADKMAKLKTGVAA
jgi:Domain of unknown function (DUF932)